MGKLFELLRRPASEARAVLVTIWRDDLLWSSRPGRCCRGVAVAGLDLGGSQAMKPNKIILKEEKDISNFTRLPLTLWLKTETNEKYTTI
jgi:hypothetical protein